jgi:hypothetical protein
MLWEFVGKEGRDVIDAEQALVQAVQIKKEVAIFRFPLLKRVAIE